MTKNTDAYPDAYRELVEGIALQLNGGLPPPSTIVDVEFGARSVRSRRQQVNEDHFLVLRLGRHQETLLSSLSDDTVMKSYAESGYCMFVADGLGGTGQGETASRLAIVTLVHLLRNFGRWNLRIDDRIAREIMDRAKRFYRHVDNAVSQQGARSADHLQTTLTAVFGAGRDLFFAHVGHSRAYLLREGRLMRLTRDHTAFRPGVTFAPQAPLVPVNESARDLRHVLTDTIGMNGSVGPQIDIERFQVFDHDVVLVCTNGLTDLVDEATIAEILASDLGPDGQCQALVDRARAADAIVDDDVTAVIAHYHIPPGV